jgi:hypothetical protein
METVKSISFIKVNLPGVKYRPVLANLFVFAFGLHTQTEHAPIPQPYAFQRKLAENPHILGNPFYFLHHGHGTAGIYGGYIRFFQPSCKTSVTRP